MPIRVKHYNYREIPFLAFVTPEDVRRAREALRISDTDADGDTFDITSYYLAALTALSQQAVKFLEQKRDAYPVHDPLSPSLAILTSIGTGHLSNRGRQANHCPYRPCSGLIPREIRNGRHSDRSLADNPYNNHDRRRQQYTSICERSCRFCPRTGAARPTNSSQEICSYSKTVTCEGTEGG